ncbi:hypothetical protein [Romboutsia sp.]|uniref:hypothetical protein n=1 Tax=Romboutsia sp. TaxID=1965302 RepID=UPI003F2F37B8
MRWMLVFLFLYLIPLIVLFKNYNNFRKSCIYSSIYIVLVSTIVITNIYISGLNKIKEAMYYQNYAFDRRYSDKYTSNFEKDFNPNIEQTDKKNKDKGNNISEEIRDLESKGSISKENILISEKETNKVAITNKNNTYNLKKRDKELVFNFKKKVYEIETIALIPMRECIPYTQNISENLKKLSTIKEDVEYAKDMCKDVASTYDNIEVPTLSNAEYTKVVENSRDDVKKAYELREKAMDNAIKLINSKNPKYVGKITEYLNLSDKHIASFKERLNDLNKKIDKQETIFN